MSLRVIASAFILALTTLSVAAQSPALIPAPREIHAATPLAIASANVMIGGGQASADDLFTAQDLTAALAERGLQTTPAVGASALTITLLHTPAAAALLSEAKLTFTPAMHDEGYILLSRPGNVALIADTSAGLFYAAQTLKQLVTHTPTGTSIWIGTIRDWPAMKYRGVHDDLSRGPFPTLAFQKHQIATLAAFKVNLYSPYFEHTMQYAGDPLAAPPGSALTRAEAQELAAFAAQYHVTIVPEQEAFGHLHHLLKFEKYSSLAETPHGHVLAPGEPRHPASHQVLVHPARGRLPQPFPACRRGRDLRAGHRTHPHRC